MDSPAQSYLDSSRFVPVRPLTQTLTNFLAIFCLLLAVSYPHNYFSAENPPPSPSSVIALLFNTPLLLLSQQRSSFPNTKNRLESPHLLPITHNSSEVMSPFEVSDQKKRKRWCDFISKPGFYFTVIQWFEQFMKQLHMYVINKN